MPDIRGLSFSLRFLALAMPALLAVPVGAACLGGGVSPEPLPTVDFLRSYRADFGAPARVAPGPGGRLYVSETPRGRILVRAVDGAMVITARVEAPMLCGRLRREGVEVELPGAGSREPDTPIRLSASGSRLPAPEQ